RALFVERPQPRLHLTQPFLHRIGGQRRLAERLARGGELLRRVAKRVGVAVKLFEAGLQMPETVRGAIVRLTSAIARRALTRAGLASGVRGERLGLHDLPSARSLRLDAREALRERQRPLGPFVGGARAVLRGRRGREPLLERRAARSELGELPRDALALRVRCGPRSPRVLGRLLRLFDGTP